MRVVDEESGAPIKKVWVTLTEDEARTLCDHLVVLFEDDPILRPWHMHLEEGDSAINIELADR